MTINFTAVTAGIRLSEQVAQQLAAEITAGRLTAGMKLPTEVGLAEQFSVSRTVVREATSRLKSLRLVDSRQGSGVYVSSSLPATPLQFNVADRDSRLVAIQLFEVRRALEVEAAGLAAQRRNTVDIARLRECLDTGVLAISFDDLEEDRRFHRAVANAAHNPSLVKSLEYVTHCMFAAMDMPRAKAGSGAEFAAQMRLEHAVLVSAIESGDHMQARAAAFSHIDDQIRRICGSN
jgi:GntR family transcriptional repressor for pyruvate dehydrogenase complex